MITNYEINQFRLMIKVKEGAKKNPVILKRVGFNEARFLGLQAKVAEYLATVNDKVLRAAMSASILGNFKEEDCARYALREQLPAQYENVTMRLRYTNAIKREYDKITANERNAANALITNISNAGIK